MKFELHWSHGMLSGNGEMSIMGLGNPAFFLELLRKSQTFQASRVWAPQSLPPRSHLRGGDAPGCKLGRSYKAAFVSEMKP